MTEHRRSKRAVRARMAQTGEKYTQARRALEADAGSAPGGGAGSGGGAGGGPPGPDVPAGGEPSPLPPDPLPWFTDQAYNVIVLACDEARMLGRGQVQPEHVLLAATRRGNAAALLAAAGVQTSAIYAALIARDGVGNELVTGPVPRSTTCEAMLWHAVAGAHARGVHGPSSEHLLLGLDAASTAVAVLRALGVADVVALVDARYHVTRPPLAIAVPGHARSARTRTPPSPGPMAPVFERFTEPARAAIARAMRRADELGGRGYPNVEPAHILLGLLDDEEGVVGSMRARHRAAFDGAVARGVELLGAGVPAGAAPSTGWPGLFSGPGHLVRRSLPTPGVKPGRPGTDATFSPAARRVVAEDVLVVAHRRAEWRLGTGHLWMAVVEGGDEAVSAILRASPGAGAITSAVAAALPGEEAG